MSEYIAKRMSGNDLEQELLKLIADYNKKSKRKLLVYTVAISKHMLETSLSMDDYYIIADLLRDADDGTLDVYLETPGGSGEAAEEIVNFLRSKFKEVNFIISGEAKSAGTLMALSGNEITMTKTGSLGPIDAQVVIGRGNVSAHDYMQWVIAKQDEADKNQMLNPFDATMVAQISPGELNGVNNALEFAHDLVVKWLPIYKFKNWDVTETKKTKVTTAMKEKRARQIALDLSDHSRWRSHGRSLKISDLESIGLKINALEDTPELCDIINHIQVVSRMLFTTTNTYKIYAFDGVKIFASAAVAGAPNMPQQQAPDNAQLEVGCTNCGKLHKIYAKLVPDNTIDENLQRQGWAPFPSDSKLVCDCGFETDLTGVKNDIETGSGRKVVQ